MTPFESNAPMSFIVAMIGGYLLGSIPFGLLLTRMAGLGDVRTIGSGNIGATNVLRTGRKDIAAATLLLDMLKGTAAVLLLGMGQPLLGVIAGCAAFLGHIFPIWLKFKGGKGVATYIGCVLGLCWPAALGFAVIWLACARLTRYSSLAALIASAATPFLLWLFNRPDAAIAAVPMTALLWFRHAENIQRLRAGTEGKIGQKT